MSDNKKIAPLPEYFHYLPEDRFDKDHPFWKLNERSKDILTDIYGAQSILCVQQNAMIRKNINLEINKLLSMLPEKDRYFTNL